VNVPNQSVNRALCSEPISEVDMNTALTDV